LRTRTCATSEPFDTGLAEIFLVVLRIDQLPAVALGPDITAAIDLAKAERAISTRKACGTDFRIFKERSG
jgi:hypothetical protein